MSAELQLVQVSKRFDAGAAPVLDDLSWTFSTGEPVAITGPSGSGKSTLLNLVGALEAPTAGRILLGDLDVSALSGQALAAFRARRLGFIFQDHHLLPQLTALENVLLPTLALPGERDAARAEGLLERVGLAGRRHAFPAQLSGGERQRVAVARALVNGPDLLLCDEPTGNLDRDTGTAVVSLLLDLAAQYGATMLMVTHNLQQAARFARCLELRGGKLQVSAAGPPEGGRGTTGSERDAMTPGGDGR